MEEQNNFSEQEKKIYLKKTGWLYTGVGIFSAIIIILFGISMKTGLANYSFKKSNEARAISSVKDDLSAYIEQEKVNLDKREAEEARQEAREKLNELVANYENNKKQGEQETPSTTAGTEETISE